MTPYLRTAVYITCDLYVTQQKRTTNVKKPTELHTKLSIICIINCLLKKKNIYIYTLHSIYTFPRSNTQASQILISQNGPVRVGFCVMSPLMIVYFLSGKHFPRSREHEIVVPLSIMGVWKSIVQIILWMNHSASLGRFVPHHDVVYGICRELQSVDECASHLTLFVQALSLELATCVLNVD